MVKVRLFLTTTTAAASWTSAAAFSWQTYPVRTLGHKTGDRITSIQHSAIRQGRRRPLCYSSSSSRNEEPSFDDDKSAESSGKVSNGSDSKDQEEAFLRKNLAHVESLEDLLEDLETYEFFDDDEDDPNFQFSRPPHVSANDDDDDDDIEALWDEEYLSELFGSLDDDDENELEDDFDNEDPLKDSAATAAPDSAERDSNNSKIRKSAAEGLEQALMQGVVPVSANVGSECLPGDFGFDPLQLASKDYFMQCQTFLLDLLPPGPGFDKTTSGTESSIKPPAQSPRPKALILRDYREAEIRHGRLAMLAAVFWPLQEQLDELLLPEGQYGPLLYTYRTLPYFPLTMTAILLLLGYLDIFSQAKKDMDSLGEAFLPGDCFWDPLRILQGAPDRMKRNMQERELFNGRVAMLAVAVFLWEEGLSGTALAHIEGNELLLEPAFEIPFVQEWLDATFANYNGLEESVDEILEESLLESLSGNLDLVSSMIASFFVGAIPDIY